MHAHLHTHTHTQPQQSTELFKNKLKIENLLEDFKQVGHQSSFKCSFWLNAFNFFHINSMSLCRVSWQTLHASRFPQSGPAITPPYFFHIIWCQATCLSMTMYKNRWLHGPPPSLPKRFHLLPPPPPEHKVWFCCLCNVISSQTRPPPAPSPPPPTLPWILCAQTYLNTYGSLFQGKCTGRFMGLL